MSLIDWKTELKLKGAKYCVLSAAGADNDNDNCNYNIFTIKGEKLYVLVVSSSAIKSHQELLVKDLKDQFIEKKLK